MNYDHDRGDWEHECKRDKNLERIADLEAQVAALEAERDRLRAENKQQGYEIAKMRHPTEQYDRLADYVIANGLWRGHQGGHTDSVIRRIQAIKAERDQLRADNDKAHELAEHYRDANYKLREALDFIAEEHDAGRHDGLPEPCPAHDAETMFAVARKTLKEVKS